MLHSGTAVGCLLADVCVVFVCLFCLSRVGLCGYASLQIVICENSHMIVFSFIIFCPGRLSPQPAVFLFHEGHMPELFKSATIPVRTHTDE